MRDSVRRTAERTTFLCEACGDTSPRWEGRCPHCGTWNSLMELPRTLARPAAVAPWLNERWSEPAELVTLSPESAPRLTLPFAEVNRVLGGGLVAGSVVLLTGDPGIGKSTLLLQVLGALSAQGQRTLYISGEESAQQVRLRAQRLEVLGKDLFFLPETSAEAILEHLERFRPALAAVESVQTLSTQDTAAGPGSIAQVRECTRLLLQWAKARQVPLLLAGHVTKDGVLAGPRALEHMVDVVLYLEGDPLSSLRLLRGEKNRFGSTSEVGVLEMRGQGFVEVPDPSRLLLQGRLEDAVGSAIVCTLEGSRPLLLEVQALVTPTVFPSPRRMANGVSLNRLLMVAAVLTKRVGLSLGAQDIAFNVVGGIRVEEPAVDLAMALAIASSMREVPLKPSLVALGELGLAGELRRVPQLQRRIAEASRLGFRQVLVPTSQREEVQDSPGLEVLAASDVRQALEQGLLVPRRRRFSPREEPSPSSRPSSSDTEGMDLPALSGEATAL